jgi:hypothetical protein
MTCFMPSVIINSYQLTCNCPDFTSKADKNLSSRHQSELIDRSWTSAKGRLLCKHLWSAIVASGLLEEFAIPKDLPTIKPNRRKIKSGVTRLQTLESRGDDFSFTDPRGATSPWIVGRSDR